jgi:hypothetical protein
MLGNTEDVLLTAIYGTVLTQVKTAIQMFCSQRLESNLVNSPHTDEKYNVLVMMLTLYI